MYVATYTYMIYLATKFFRFLLCVQQDSYTTLAITEHFLHAAELCIRHAKGSSGLGSGVATLGPTGALALLSASVASPLVFQLMYHVNYLLSIHTKL